MADTPASEPFHPLFPDLFHESATPVISSSHSKFSYTGICDNHEHTDGVSQSHYEIDESPMPDLFHPQTLNSQMSDCLSQQPQDVSFIDSSQLLTPGKSNILVDGGHDSY